MQPTDAWNNLNILWLKIGTIRASMQRNGHSKGLLQRIRKGIHTLYLTRKNLAKWSDTKVWRKLVSTGRLVRSKITTATSDPSIRKPRTAPSSLKRGRQNVLQSSKMLFQSCQVQTPSRQHSYVFTYMCVLMLSLTSAFLCFYLQIRSYMFHLRAHFSLTSSHFSLTSKRSCIFQTL